MILSSIKLFLLIEPKRDPFTYTQNGETSQVNILNHGLSLEPIIVLKDFIPDLLIRVLKYTWTYKAMNWQKM